MITSARSENHENDKIGFEKVRIKSCSSKMKQNNSTELLGYSNLVSWVRTTSQTPFLFFCHISHYPLESPYCPIGPHWISLDLIGPPIN